MVKNRDDNSVARCCPHGDGSPLDCSRTQTSFLYEQLKQDLAQPGRLRIKSSLSNIGERDNVAAELVLEPGVKRSFGLRDVGADGLVSGWATPEDDHIWNDGPTADLAIGTRSAQSNYRLDVEARPFLAPGCASQDVTLFANGLFVGYWQLREAKHYVLSANVDKGLFLRTSGLGVMKLTWLVPKSCRPSDLRLGNDHREIGLCFQSITLRAEH
jgi:hypothetical protein